MGYISLLIGLIVVGYLVSSQLSSNGSLSDSPLKGGEGFKGLEEARNVSAAADAIQSANFGMRQEISQEGVMEGLVPSPSPSPVSSKNSLEEVIERAARERRAGG